MEQIVYQVLEMPTFFFDDLEVARFLPDRPNSAKAEGFSEHAYLGDRRPKFVRNTRHEILLKLRECAFAAQLVRRSDRQHERNPHHSEQERHSRPG